jgi:hypothetical protein
VEDNPHNKSTAPNKKMWFLHERVRESHFSGYNNHGDHGHEVTVVRIKFAIATSLIHLSIAVSPVISTTLAWRDSKEYMIGDYRIPRRPNEAVQSLIFC